MGFFNFVKNYAKGGFSPFALLSAISGVNPIKGISSLYKGFTGAGLTGAQQEANAFNAEQAQKQMDFQQQMRDTQYQSAVNDMQKAGLNPAIMYGRGASGNVAPSGAMASSVDAGKPQLDPIGLLGQIANLRLLGAQRQDLLAGVKEKEANARATIMNAWSNFRNASSQERQASVAEARVNIERMLADKHIEVDQASIDKMASEASYINELKDFVSKNYEVLVKNADSLQKQALAALRQADAALQNASTNSYLADYSTDLMYSNTLLNSIVRGEHNEILKKLPEKLRYEVENLQKQGVVLDNQGRLIDKQGKLATAMQVKAYVSCATDVAKTVASFIPGATSVAPSANIDLTGFGAYGSY